MDLLDLRTEDPITQLFYQKYSLGQQTISFHSITSTTKQALSGAVPKLSLVGHHLLPTKQVSNYSHPQPPISSVMSAILHFSGWTLQHLLMAESP